jgi:hypothetical protein
VSTTLASVTENFGAWDFVLPFQHNFQSMHIITRRDISTTGTITAMSKIGMLFFFFEQYVSLTFEHTGLPSNLVTQLQNISIDELKIS